MLAVSLALLHACLHQLRRLHNLAVRTLGAEGAAALAGEAAAPPGSPLDEIDEIDEAVVDDLLETTQELSTLLGGEWPPLEVGAMLGLRAWLGNSHRRARGRVEAHVLQQRVAA